MTADRRSLASNGRVADIALRGQVTADRFVKPVLHRVIVPVADLLAAPGGARDRQLLLGEGFAVLDVADGFAFGRAVRDGYVGYLAASALGDGPVPTHSVVARATHRYAAPDIRAPEDTALSFGTQLAVEAVGERFARLATGGFVPLGHLVAVGTFAADPVEVAGRFLGAPYLWGGNSAWGIDCSGLVQAAALACGIDCPGDSDQQRAAFAVDGAADAPHERGDLIFWRGHVSMVCDGETMIHANAHHMAVAIERIADAIARIEAAGDGRPVARGRLARAG